MPEVGRQLLEQHDLAYQAPFVRPHLDKVDTRPGLATGIIAPPPDETVMATLHAARTQRANRPTQQIVDRHLDPGVGPGGDEEADDRLRIEGVRVWRVEDGDTRQGSHSGSRRQIQAPCHTGGIPTYGGLEADFRGLWCQPAEL